MWDLLNVWLFLIGYKVSVLDGLGFQQKPLVWENWESMQVFLPVGSHRKDIQRIFLHHILPPFLLAIYLLSWPFNLCRRQVALQMKLMGNEHFSSESSGIIVLLVIHVFILPLD